MQITNIRKLTEKKVTGDLDKCPACQRPHEELIFEFCDDSQWKGHCRQTGQPLIASIDPKEIR
jgi:hypothetical protein